MITMDLTCILTGKDFSPASAEKLTGYRFLEKNERGEIAKAGRYKGLPFPYGSCIIRDVSNQEAILDILEKYQTKLLGNGVESIVLQLNVAYESQCNFELNENFLARIARLSVPLSISCFEKDQT